MPAVDADVVLVAKGRDREIDARYTILAGRGFGVFDCPAGVAVFLAQLGWLCRPLRGNAACLDVALFAVGIAVAPANDAAARFKLLARIVRGGVPSQPELTRHLEKASNVLNQRFVE